MRIEEQPLVVVSSSSDFPVNEEVIAEVFKDKARYCLIDLPMVPLSPEKEDNLIKELAAAKAFFVRPGMISRNVLMNSKQLKIIAVHGAGVDQIDIAAATEAGIMVTNVPGGNANGVAELALGLMLALVRRIPQCARMVQHEGKWEEARWKGNELMGKTLGVVGCGNVGKRVITLARAFDMSVMAYDPFIPADVIQKYGATPADLDTILKACDILTLHIPLSEKTKHLISKRELAMMKKGALLVNAARGSIVDGQALYQSLHDGQLGGAALDVMEKEPPGPDPLLSLPNVIVTPHMAGSTYEALATIARVACEDIVRVLEGKEPQHCVNQEGLKGVVKK